MRHENQDLITTFFKYFKGKNTAIHISNRLTNAREIPLYYLIAGVEV